MARKKKPSSPQTPKAKKVVSEPKVKKAPVKKVVTKKQVVKKEVVKKYRCIECGGDVENKRCKRCSGSLVREL